MKNKLEEILIVVDEDDNVLDYLPRSEVHKKELLHRTISVTVFNSKGQVLLQKRSMKMDSNPGRWANAVGGHVSKGKSYEEAAEDEMKEEMNLSLKPTFVKRMKINDPEHTTMTCLYRAKSDGPFKPKADEIDEIGFFTRDEVFDMIDQLSESTKITLKEQGVLS